MSHFDVSEWSSGGITRLVRDRQHLARKETEDFLRRQSESWLHRQHELWQPNYNSVEAYEKSVEPNRDRWKAALGLPEIGKLPEATEDPAWHPFLEDEEMIARWIYVPVSPGLHARAIFAVPRDHSGQLGLVIAQHGIGSSPERVMGFGDEGQLYHGYGRELVRAGFAVLVPQHITEVGPRSRLHRMCVMLGFTLWGLELHKLSRLLDVVLAMPEIDSDHVGMWGISLGGAYTIFALPVEERIRAGVCTAWFNDRYRKMIIDDPRYSCFLSTNEEYVFIPNWLKEFHDHNLVSLICPRPFQIQSGKGDGIAWWPYLQEEFEKSRHPYVQLGRDEAIEFDLREGGHEIHLESGISFFTRWLS